MRFFEGKNKYLSISSVAIIFLSLLVMVSGSYAQEEFFTDVEKAELLPMEDSVGSGTGISYRGQVEEGVEYFVVADLIDPPQGTFYEAWLVKEAPEIGLTSIGMLEKQDDLYFLRVLTEEGQAQYREMVITLESQGLGENEVPETEILRGVFMDQDYN